MEEGGLAAYTRGMIHPGSVSPPPCCGEDPRDGDSRVGGAIPRIPGLEETDSGLGTGESVRGPDSWVYTDE